MLSLSIVIPALNEVQNIPYVIQSIPVAELSAQGWNTEILVVDNASTDGTGQVARRLGATVIEQPVRGYGNAYKAGIANSTGAVIATGDADCTYPFEDLPSLLGTFVIEDLDFLNTDRLSQLRSESMACSHVPGNLILTAATRILFKSPFRDSQSGMWIFSRNFWENSSVKSAGMAFSQEIKIAALIGGYRCAEVPIDYRQRGGEKKLNSFPDGVRNLAQLILHRFRLAGGRSACAEWVVPLAFSVPSQRRRRSDTDILQVYERLGEPKRDIPRGGMPDR